MTQPINIGFIMPAVLPGNVIFPIAKISGVKVNAVANRSAPKVVKPSPRNSASPTTGTP